MQDRTRWGWSSALLACMIGCTEDAAPMALAAGEQSASVAEAQAPLLDTLRAFRDDDTSSLFKLLGKNAQWKLVSSTPMQGWQTFHTQGMVKIGDVFYVSSVEVLESTVRNGTSTDALYDFSTDRSAGAGRGWVSKFDASGKLLGQVELGVGDAFHPGGMDFDGESLWVPVAEYRPNSHSVVYRVDPDSLEAFVMFEVDDHIGGVVKNRHRGTVHGVSWGSRRLYTWTTQGKRLPLQRAWVANSAFYVDYQDCQYLGVQYMLCGGVGGYATPRGDIAFGGLELVDLVLSRPEHQIPVNQFVDDGSGVDPTLSLAHNAFWAEPLNADTMRIYFMTERDNQADLLAYDVTPWVNR